MPTFSISVVYYRPNISQAYACIRSLNTSLWRLHSLDPAAEQTLHIIDNSTDEEVALKLNHLIKKTISCESSKTKIISLANNLGYGTAHNIAIMETKSDYHLILNPDVLLDEDALLNAIQFIESHPDVAMLTPAAVNERGEKEYLNKRYPGLLTLIIRGFAPAPLKRRFFLNRVAHYELRDLDPNQVHFDIPLASGCFMLFRTSVLKQLGGFSEKFFLYFEDYDLSLRTHKYGKIAYVPNVKITHFGGGAAHKGMKHIYYFIRSAVTFFNLHGWKLW